MLCMGRVDLDGLTVDPRPRRACLSCSRRQIVAAGGEREEEEEEEEGERWIKPAKGSNEGRGEKATCSQIVQKNR